LANSPRFIERILLVEEAGLGVFGHMGFGFGFGLGGEGAAGGGGDEAEDLDGLEGEAGNEEAEGIGAGVGWGEEEAAVVEEGVGEGEVEGGEAFEDFAIAEGEAEPDAVAAGAGGEGQAADALGINFVTQVEIPDVRYALERADRKGSQAAVWLEEGELTVVQEATLGEVSPGEFV
jgi:hypothetical protein